MHTQDYKANHSNSRSAANTAGKGTSMPAVPIQKKENKTGMPDNLKNGVEHLSGLDMSDVKVHYNSSRPAQLNALAYAQGTDIHISPGQEQHLPHEAWHVAQQKQGRVQATMQMKTGVQVNDDPGLEKEADAMGAKAIQMKVADVNKSEKVTPAQRIMQRRVVLTADSPRKTDSVEYNSINFGQTVAGGTFEEFKSSDFSTLAPSESIALVGHGSPGHSGSYSGKTIADRLTGVTPSGKGMTNGDHNIIFTSCYAGTKKKDGHEIVPTTVIDEVKDAVFKKWPGAVFNIKGAEGPSVKTIEDGKEKWGIVDDLQMPLAGAIQRELNNCYAVNISAEVARLSSEDDFGTATRVATATKPYFVDFINMINRDWGAVSSKFKTHITTLAHTAPIYKYAQELQGLSSTTTKLDSKVNEMEFKAPFVAINHPKDNEAITADAYSIRMDGNQTVNNVKVQIQKTGTTGDWNQARQSEGGAWWFDWTGIERDSYEIKAKAWNAKGEEKESAMIRASKS